MADHERKVAELRAAADKKMKGGFFSGPKWDEAADLLSKAGNVYKLAKKWDAAGDVFLEAADCWMKATYGHDAANCFVSASACYKKAKETEKAMDALKRAIHYFTNEGRFSIAARHQREIAEHYEAQGDIESAIEAYEEAADYFESENGETSAQQCRLKVADFSATLSKYEKAIEIYESVAASALTNKLLKYGVKDYFFKAGLCHFCTGDLVETKRALDRYLDMDYTFSQTRECTFLNSIYESYSNFDVEAFTNATMEFDRISKLDSWKTTILLRIKNKIKDEDPTLC